MPTDVHQIVKRYRADSRRIHRARRLYRRLVCVPIVRDDPTRISEMAQRVIDHGLLWEGTELKFSRYGILREWYKMEAPRGRKNNYPSWHDWYGRMGFTCYIWLHHSDPESRMRLRRNTG